MSSGPDSAHQLRGGSNRAPAWEGAVCLAAALVVLAAAFALFWFAQPLADDFSRAYKGREQGVIAATLHEYETWTGRWAATGVNYFLTSKFDLIAAYPLLLMIAPAVLAIAVYSLLAAADIGTSFGRRLALTACALAVYWAGMPHPGESVYWLTGNTDNLLGPAVLMLVLAGILGHRCRSAARTIAEATLLCLLALLATGFHELFALMLCILLAGGCLVLWRQRDPRRMVCTACLMAAVAGFMVVYLAPGNEVRRADFASAGSVSTTARLAIKQGMYNVVPWVMDVRLLSASALALMLMPRAVPAPESPRAAGGRDLVLLGLTWAGAIVAAFVAASWAIGMEMPARTRNAIYLLFLLGWFWLLLMLFRHLADRKPPMMVATPLMRRLAVGLFVASLLMTGNTWEGIQDLPRAAPAYHQALDNRWHALEVAAARGEREVLVEPVHHRPRSYITYFELSTDPEHWVNWSVAHYFGLSTVALPPAEEE